MPGAHRQTLAGRVKDSRPWPLPARRRRQPETALGFLQNLQETGDSDVSPSAHRRSCQTRIPTLGHIQGEQPGERNFRSQRWSPRTLTEGMPEGPLPGRESDTGQDTATSSTVWWPTWTNAHGWQVRTCGVDGDTGEGRGLAAGEPRAPASRAGSSTLLTAGMWPPQTRCSPLTEQTQRRMPMWKQTDVPCSSNFPNG